MTSRPYRNLAVTNVCAACGATFHPHRGREGTSRFCSCRCANTATRTRRKTGLPTPSFFGENLWLYAHRGAPDECWEWAGPLDPTGYGRYWFKKKPYKAHRAAYQLVHGVDPGEWLVCHSCDNRRCVNPAHLWLGTQQDNILDKAVKRRCRGPRIKNMPLKDVKAIREDHRTYRVIADAYGLSTGTISGIKRRKLYAWLA